MAAAAPFRAREIRLRDGRVVLFRSARPDDAALFSGYYAGLSPRSRDFMHGWSTVDPARHSAALAAKTRSSDHCAVVAADPASPGRIVGYCWIDGLRTMAVPMLGIGIVDSYHEAGMGKRIMRAALDIAAAAGIPRICLGVWTDNARAVHVYRSVGFRDFPDMPAKDYSGRTELYMVADTGYAGPPPPRQFVLADLAGSPREIGRQHGMLLRSQIARALGVMRTLLKGAPEAPDAAAAYAALSIPYCRAQAPELMEEVEGIAEGSGAPLEEIFTLNASLDLILSRDRWTGSAGPGVAPDCWSLAIGGSAAGGVPGFVAWAAEDSAQWLGSCVLLRITPAAGLPCLVWTFAGFVGRPGMNGHVALGAVAQPAQDCGQGMPYPFLCRKALACRSVEEAARAIEGYRRMAGMGYVFADERGAVGCLRTTARTVRRDLRASGRVACAGRWADERLPRLDALLSALTGPVTRESLLGMAADHGPGNLCPHDASLACLTSTIADLGSRALWASHGNPCRSPHVRYAL
jgi:isopenicillin-N N-acyltransferase like protein